MNEQKLQSDRMRRPAGGALTPCDNGGTQKEERLFPPGNAKP